MIHSQHPAVAVAQSRVAELDDGFGTGFAPTAIRVIDDAVAVTMDSTKARFIIIMEDIDGEWSAPSTLVGTTRPDGPRAERTPDHLPLKQMSRKRVPTLRAPDQSWFAVAGLAAQDAAEVSIVVDGHEYREPIDANGTAFAIVRIREGQEPTAFVHTRDGRAVKATH
ncbi:hypothetical protein [Nocardia miyunensis]|uniref:hypothetical protein n=1 Tax=Nocardia miyunensis TaxID=282684 RepID=UPI00082F5371|nr:hypothetical protein [Nocardia miyunensis]